MYLQVQTILVELRHELEALYGERLSRLVLFGSHARGEADPQSDIDVLIVLKDDFDAGLEVKRTSDIRLKLSLEYGTVVSCVYASEDTFHNWKSPLMLNVRREGVPI